MSAGIRAIDELALTDKARGELDPSTPLRPAIPSWCASLWGDDTVHQCVLAPRHADGCVCACGEKRAAS